MNNKIMLAVLAFLAAFLGDALPELVFHLAFKAVFKRWAGHRPRLC